VVESGRHPWLRWPSFPYYRDELAGLYAPRAYQALWLEAGRPTAPAESALAVLAEAPAKGLDAADYDVALLREKSRALSAGGAASAEELALFDAALSVGLLRMISDLHIGKVNPRNVDFALDVAPKEYDLAALVAKAVREDRVREAVVAAEPRFRAYRHLVAALATYRALAATPGLAPVVIAPPLRPGDSFDGAPALALWLHALGDLLPDDPAPTGPRYEGALVAAVERFQRRHGIEADGVVGPVTARTLAVPAAARVRQIELTLERYRWIPELGDERLVLVNLPAFELFAFDRVDAWDAPALAMRVVVGRAGRTPTPVLASTLRHVVFGPYWNVPRSIAHGEILPKLHADLGYLARQEMEIVADGTVLSASAESVERVAAGTARVRQRPGAKNALGRVKFLFPNPHDVYLHDTPSQRVFTASRRDFSHGCVRVEQPEAFARWVLAGQSEWTEARIAGALATPAEQWVPVARPPVVLLFYATAVARAGGTASFYEDLYGHDAELERVLAAGYPFAR
jgi:murein L,D-transpeptidase YcbB/YkuD